MNANSIVVKAARHLLALLLVVCSANAQIPWSDGSWQDNERIGDEARFLSDREIQRYKLTTKTWLPPVTLPRYGATAMAADADGAVVAYGTSIYQYAADYTGDVPLGTTSTAIRSLFLDGDLVIAVHSSGLYGRITIFDRTTGLELSSIERHIYSIYGASHAPKTQRIYGRTRSLIPPLAISRGYTDDGIISDANLSSPQVGDANTGKTWVFPKEERLVDSTGAVFSAPGLINAGNLGVGGILDIDFNGDVPIVLRAGELLAFTSGLTKTGRHVVASNTRSKLYVTDEEAFVFTPYLNTAPSVEIVPLASLNAPQPGTPNDPNGLSYTIDDAFVDRDGDLMLISKSQLSLFRWSPAKRSYTDSIPLRGVPSHTAYSGEDHRLYLAYTDREIHTMDLALSDAEESWIFTMPMPLYHGGLAAAGEFVFAVNPAGNSHTHYVLSSNGDLLDSDAGNDRSRVFEWDPVKRRMYFFRDRVTPNNLQYDTIDAAGKITGGGTTPYDVGFAVAPPIRVSPDGSKVVIGSGVVFETGGLTRIGDALPGLTDALWREQRLVTLHETGTRTQIRSWDASTLVEHAALPSVPGTPVRILALDAENIALVTMEVGVPRIQILNENLEILHTFISTPAAVENVPFSWTPTFDWSALGTGSLMIHATLLPDWLGFSNGTFSGTPRAGDAGDQVDRRKSHRVALRAVNSQGQHEEREFEITAHWRNNPPVLPERLPAIIANDQADDIQFDAGPFLVDPDGRDVHFWDILENPNPEIFADLGINDHGVLDIAFAPYVSGNSNITLQVTDASGSSAQTTVEIQLPPPPRPQVTVETEPTLSRLTGLYEQRITVTNIAGRAITGFELSVTGLREGVVLYNGSSNGGNGGAIAYRQPMQPGESVALVLEYFANPRGTVPTPVLSVALATPDAPQLAVLAGVAAPLFEVNRLVKKADGSVVIEFNSIPGEHYRIHYSRDAVNWTPCPVPIQAGGTKVQWLDRGPPCTDSLPSSVPRRFYRVQHLEP